MRPDLLIPLDCLPGPVPVGAPQLYQTPSGDWMPWDALGRRWSSSDPDGWTWQERALVEAWPVALDLSRPPVDANGWPTRVDGADMAASMLARSMGTRSDFIGGIAFAGCYPGGWFLSAERWQFFHAPGAVGMDGAFVIAALADIDPQDPDADRLALAAVIKAKPWRT